MPIYMGFKSKKVIQVIAEVGAQDKSYMSAWLRNWSKSMSDQEQGLRNFPAKVMKKKARKKKALPANTANPDIKLPCQAGKTADAIRRRHAMLANI